MHPSSFKPVSSHQQATLSISGTPAGLLKQSIQTFGGQFGPDTKYNVVSSEFKILSPLMSGKRFNTMGPILTKYKASVALSFLKTPF